MRKQVNYLILKFLKQVYPDSLTVKMIEALLASLEDLKKLYGLVEGVVVGKAIYEGKIDLRELK